MFNHLTAGDHFINLIIVAIAFSATSTEAAGRSLGFGINSLNPDIAQPKFEIVVGVSKSISYFELEVINEYLLCIVAKGVAARLVDSML